MIAYKLNTKYYATEATAIRNNPDAVVAPAVVELAAGVMRRELANGELVDFTAAEVVEAEQALIPQPPTKEEQARTITTRLTAIDVESVRPLRATLAGSATTYEADKLAALEVEAAALRVELATLLTP
jgi:hypothetical protein